ncbi:MAG: methyltransferase [Chloroflexi bacterium]|nr:methyltransferase [Chloroflexota bacterium]
MAAPSPDPGSVRAVRELLLAAGYSTAGIAAIGIEVELGVREPDIAILSRALEGVEPLATLVRLFLLGEHVDTRALPGAVERATADLAAAGLLVVDGSRIRPRVRLTPWRGLIVAHDPDPPGDLWDEHVSGPTPAADALLQLVPADAAPGARALDMGTGCGLLALAIEASVRGVVATDINPVALRYTALNAGLNGISTIETRAGSWFEPVEEESFGLIVANPPFVISPESSLIFRHSPHSRDEASRDVVRSIAGHLQDGGYGYALVNWIQAPGRPWLDTIAGWLEGTGCDAVVLLHGIDDPLAYAVRWNVREQQLRPDRYPATLDRWLDHFRDESIAAIATAGVVLRRRSMPNWRHGIELTGRGRGAAGPQIRAIVAGQDFLQAHDAADDLLRTAFTMDTPHRLYQTLAFRDGEYVVEPAALGLEEGLGIPVAVEPDLIQVALRLDGSQTLAGIVQEVAEATGADSVSLSNRSIELVRALLGQGFAAAGAGGRTGPA